MKPKTTLAPNMKDTSGLGDAGNNGAALAAANSSADTAAAAMGCSGAFNLNGKLLGKKKRPAEARSDVTDAEVAKTMAQATGKLASLNFDFVAVLEILGLMSPVGEK